VVVTVLFVAIGPDEGGRDPGGLYRNIVVGVVKVEGDTTPSVIRWIDDNGTTVVDVVIAGSTTTGGVLLLVVLQLLLLFILLRTAT
jgi:hypothetical protein